MEGRPDDRYPILSIGRDARQAGSGEACYNQENDVSKDIAAKMRMERIDRLLNELKYEVTRGFMETEIDETIGFTFIVPVSRQIKNGVVLCQFYTRPVHRDTAMGRSINSEPRLQVVK